MTAEIADQKDGRRVCPEAERRAALIRSPPRSIGEAYQVEIDSNEGDLNINPSVTSFQDSCIERQLFPIADDAGFPSSCTLQPLPLTNRHMSKSRPRPSANLWVVSAMAAAMFTPPFPCPIPELWPSITLVICCSPFRSPQYQHSTDHPIPSYPALLLPSKLKMTRAVSLVNLAKLSHLSTRTRYRLLLTCFVLTTAHLLFSASLIRWSSNLSKPPRASSDNASKSSNNVSSKEHIPPYGAEDAGRPVVPQAKLLKDFFTWNEAGIASLSPPVFLPPTPPSPPITDPFPLLSSNLPPRKLRRLLQPPEINRPSHFRHLHPSHSSQGLTQQPSRSYFSRFGSKSFGRRPDPPTSSPYHSSLNPTGMAPLLIGFTRNWPLLLQCVSSYIAAGWPAEEIYVVENTGTMDANERELLGLQNPFFMNRTQLGMLGVNVVSVGAVSDADPDSGLTPSQG